MAHGPSADTPAGSQWGIEALRLMLEDIDFPRDGDSLHRRVKDWRIPMPGQETVRLGPLLEPFEDKTFRSPKAVLKALKKRYPSLGDPRGPWPGQDED